MYTCSQIDLNSSLFSDLTSHICHIARMTQQSSQLDNNEVHTAMQAIVASKTLSYIPNSNTWTAVREQT